MTGMPASFRNTYASPRGIVGNPIVRRKQTPGAVGKNGDEGNNRPSIAVSILWKNVEETRRYETGKTTHPRDRRPNDGVGKTRSINEKRRNFSKLKILCDKCFHGEGYYVISLN